MPAGLEIRDSNGNVIMETNTSLVKIVSKITLPSADGSYNEPLLQSVVDGVSRFIYFLTPTDSSGTLFQRPNITRSGTTVFWSWPDPSVKPSHNLALGFF